jgi:hypothetical protein
MGIDTTFEPLGPTIYVGPTTPVQIQLSMGASSAYTVRTRCTAGATTATGSGALTTNAYFAYGPTAVAAAAAIASAPPTGAAPTTYSPNVIGMFVGMVETFEIPTNSFVVSNAATSSFEMTPGKGA